MRFSRSLISATVAAFAGAAALSVGGVPAAHATGTPPLPLKGKSLSVWTGYSNIKTDYDVAMQSFGFRSSTSAVYVCQETDTTNKDDTLTEYQTSTDLYFNENTVSRAGHCNQMGVGGADPNATASVNERTVWIPSSGGARIKSGVFHGTKPPSALRRQTEYNPALIKQGRYSVNVNARSNRLVVKYPARGVGDQHFRLYTLSTVQTSGLASAAIRLAVTRKPTDALHGYAVINNWVYYVTQADSTAAAITIRCFNYDKPRQTCDPLHTSIPNTGRGKYEVEGLSVNPGGNLVIGVNEGSTTSSSPVKMFSLFKLT